jgi:undecaprenyl diphosphate synthase
MNSVPQSIGIILDGNRRWAKEKGLPTLEGHRAGYENVKTIARAAFSKGVKYVTVYAFSTENWKRTEEEVSYLMNLLAHAVKKDLEELTKDDISVRFIGELDRLPDGLGKVARELEEKTKNNDRGTLTVAISYGGRAEIVSAVNKLLRERKEVISEEDLSSAMWAHDIPDPDLIIRTSGERRLSGFLTWESIYSELFFTKTYWPDFSEEELTKILDEYASRERRHGK